MAVAVRVVESGAEDGDRAVALDGEVDVLSGAGEVLAVPDEVAFTTVSWVLRLLRVGTHRCRCQCDRQG